MVINAKFEPSYKTFFQRAIAAIITTLLVSVVYWFIAFQSDIYYPVTILVFILLIFCLLFFTIRRTIKHLRSITVTNEKIILEIVKFDAPYKTVELDIQKVNIKIYDSLLASWGRKFNLIIDTKNDKGIYYTIFKQGETGGWNLDIFKSVYINYCDATGKTAYTSSLTSFGFFEKKRRG